MALPTILFFATTLLFGGIAILLGLKNEKLQREITENDAVKKRRLYEISILKAIQDRIGYSLDLEQVIDTVTISLKNLFPYATASSLIAMNGKLVFKTYIEERVNSLFIDQVKRNMIASLATITNEKFSQIVQESRRGLAVDETNPLTVRSFFQIPLVVSGTVVGLINVASTTSGLYKEADMTILYQIVTQASNALSRLQEVISTEEGKLLGMIKSLADGVCMIDGQDQVTFINQRAKEFLELPSKDKPSIFDLLRKLSGKYDFSEKIQMVMKQNIPFEEKELPLGNRFLQITITPVRQISSNENDLGITQKVIGVSILMHDITLERSVSNLKEEFTNAIVHELRSPLTAMKAASELMITEKERLTENQKEKLLTVIHEQTIRMLSDIGSLLDAAKLESGNFTLYKKVANIQDVLQESLSLFAPEAQNKKITMQLAIAKDIKKGFFDPGRIGQVVNNLLSNSLKFTPAGGTILIHAQNYLNEYLPATSTNPGIIISISDTGIGIPKEKQAMLFSKFSQIGNLVNIHDHEGTGLGLYIAKGIVATHKGNIFLQSLPNQGTTVSFTLPTAQIIS